MATKRSCPTPDFEASPKRSHWAETTYHRYSQGQIVQLLDAHGRKTGPALRLLSGTDDDITKIFNDTTAKGLNSSIGAVQRLKHYLAKQICYDVDKSYIFTTNNKSHTSLRTFLFLISYPSGALIPLMLKSLCQPMYFCSLNEELDFGAVESSFCWVYSELISISHAATYISNLLQKNGLVLGDYDGIIEFKVPVDKARTPHPIKLPDDHYAVSMEYTHSIWSLTTFSAALKRIETAYGDDYVTVSFHFAKTTGFLVPFADRPYEEDVTGILADRLPSESSPTKTIFVKVEERLAEAVMQIASLVTFCEYVMPREDCEPVVPVDLVIMQAIGNVVIHGHHNAADVLYDILHFKLSHPGVTMTFDMYRDGGRSIRTEKFGGPIPWRPHPIGLNLAPTPVTDEPIKYEPVAPLLPAVDVTHTTERSPKTRLLQLADQRLLTAGLPNKLDNAKAIETLRHTSSYLRQWRYDYIKIEADFHSRNNKILYF